MVTGRGERLRSIGSIALLVILAACTDTTTSVRVTERTRGVATVVASPTLTAVAIGNITAYGVNDAGTIFGPSSGKNSSAYLWWDPSAGLLLLGNGGFPWSVAEDGRTVAGKNAAGAAVVWTASSLTGPWTEQVIPDVGFGGAVRAIASDGSGAPLMMTGNVWTNGTIKITQAPKETTEDAPIRIPMGPPPEVVFSAPTSEETDVQLATNVRIQFSRDINPATFKGNIAVKYSEAETRERGEPDTPRIDFTNQYLPGTRVLELKFANPLERFRTVTVQLSDGILGSDKQPLKPWTLNFQTGP